jgi:hypothetical protein
MTAQEEFWNWFTQHERELFVKGSLSFSLPTRVEIVSSVLAASSGHFSQSFP